MSIAQVVYSLMFSFCLSWTFAQEEAPNSLPSENKTQESVVPVENQSSPDEEIIKDKAESKIQSKKEINRTIRKEGFVPYEERRQISREYFQGPGLLYNCLKQHYACVDLASFVRCEQLRKDEIAYSDRELLPCVPIMKYENVTDCNKDLVALVDLPRQASICLRPQKIKNK